MVSNTFDFELLDARNLDNHIEWITDAVTKATITEGWRSDYRSSASISIDGKSLRWSLGTAQRYAVRIYHTRRDASGETTEVLGTFITDGLDRDLGLGRWTGTLSLYSLLMKEGTDLRMNDRQMAAGTDIRSLFASIVENSGGTCRIDDSITGSLGASHIWEAGKSALSELQNIADACNGYVGVDAMGNITLTPYLAPADRPYAWHIDTTEATITDELQETIPDVVNRVVCHHESGDLSAGAVCSLDDIAPAHKWCRSNIGRWATEDYSVPAIPDWVTTNDQLSSYLRQQAERRLRELAGASDKYSATMLYDPRMKTGSRGSLSFDIGTEAVWRNVYITQREIELDAAMRMDLTLEVI